MTSSTKTTSRETAAPAACLSSWSFGLSLYAVEMGQLILGTAPQKRFAGHRINLDRWPGS